MAETLARDAVVRVTAALIGAELVAAGRSIPQAEQARWDDALGLGAGALALDSLELLACGAAVNRFFHLHETGIEDLLLMEKTLAGWARIVSRSLEERFERVTFSTSGSTGEPKAVEHEVSALRGEVAHWADVFAGRERVVALVPPHHIYGFLFTAMLPQRLGVGLLDGRALSPGTLRRELSPGDLLVGHPTTLALLVKQLPRLPEGLVAVSSTAPLPAATHDALRAAGCEAVVEVYGSSETGGVGWRRDPASGFRLLPRWTGGEAGEAASVVERASGRGFALPDRVEWGSDDGFRLLGRKDEAVQVGGVNVFPRALEARLRALPGVADAAVRLDTTLPEPRLKAFVVPRAGEDGPAVARAVHDAARQNWPAVERLAHVTWGATLPRNAMGKPADWPRSAKIDAGLEGEFTDDRETAA